MTDVFENALRFYQGKTVLVTGHTGFKGAWLSLWLNKLGARVVGFSVGRISKPNHFDLLQAEMPDLCLDVEGDVTELMSLRRLIRRIRPDVVFHLAAQSIVSKGYQDPVRTWSTNCLGSVNLLWALKCEESSASVVMVTSDKCYENKEWPWGYREIDRLGGIDPYSASKAAAEIAISSFHRSFANDGSGFRVVSARAGNVLGGGDWAANRIIPDAMKACLNQTTLEIRNPLSTRPWQHVLEPLSGYLMLGFALNENKISSGEAFNFGPSAATTTSVAELISRISEAWSKYAGRPLDFNISNVSVSTKHEAGLLQLNCDKASNQLNWSPTLDLETTADWIAKWFWEYECKRPMTLVSLDQIEDFTYQRRAGLNG